MGRVGGWETRTRKVFFQIGPRAFFFSPALPLPFLNMGRASADGLTLSPSSTPPSPTFTPLPIGRRCTSLSNQPLPQSSLSRPPRRPIRPAREGAREGAQSNLAISFRSSDCDGQCCKMAFRESPLHSCGRRGAKWPAEVWKYWRTYFKPNGRFK